jgi:hypothetical protein
MQICTPLYQTVYMSWGGGDLSLSVPRVFTRQVSDFKVLTNGLTPCKGGLEAVPVLAVLCHCVHCVLTTRPRLVDYIWPPLPVNMFSCLPVQ